MGCARAAKRPSRAKAIDFSRCDELSQCEGFVFEAPDHGSYCGPYCGYDLVDTPGTDTGDATGTSG